MRLKGKTAVITGGAHGIGRATALAFASEGANVAICDLSMEEMEDLLLKLKEMPGKAAAFAINVLDREAVAGMMGQVAEHFGSLDILVNNAGITDDSQLVKMEEDAFDKVIAVNLKGVFNCGQAAARIMKEQGGGVILNASSLSGLYGNFGQTNYAAAKWGVIGMAKTWAKELGKYGIRSNAVAPGFILTPMTEKMPEKVLTMMKDKSPLNRLGTPDDVASAYVFLASDEASFITGTVLSVDGGVVL